MIAKILDLLKSPEFYAAVLGLLALLRALGEFFMYIGRIIPGEDWAENLSAKIAKLCTGLGKLLSWFGIGNNTKK